MKWKVYYQVVLHTLAASDRVSNKTKLTHGYYTTEKDKLDLMRDSAVDIVSGQVTLNALQTIHRWDIDLLT